MLARHVDNFGYSPNPAGVAKFLEELDEPRFAQAGSECMKKIVRKDTFLYQYANRAHLDRYGKPFTLWNQGSAGTCVSFGWGLGSYIGQSVAWAHDEVEKAPLLVATEPIYGGSRTLARLPPVTFAGWSDGSYGAAAARWVSGKCKDPAVGGILYRQVYGQHDLTAYSINTSRQWGAYGPPREIAVESAKHRALSVAQVSTWDELAAAICSGYCVPVCSNVGFEATNVRDKDGFLPRGGTWNHCLCVIGIRFADGTGKRDGALIANSWGTRWVTGPRWPDDQPEGSFWATRADIEAILKQGDSFAIGSVAGFPWRKLEHKEWMQPAPKQTALAVSHALAL